MTCSHLSHRERIVISSGGHAVDDLRERLTWFKSVILPHQGILRSRLRRIAPPGADIDDLVAETLARAYGTKDWRRITAGRAYLLMIARNMLIDAARRDAVVSFYQFGDFDGLRHDHSLEAALSARDELRQLEKIIATLPTQSRRAFVLRRVRSEEHTSELQSLMRISYAVFCLKKKKSKQQPNKTTYHS